MHRFFTEVFFRWFIFRFLRLLTFKFIHENINFLFKSEFNRQKHLCKFTALRKLYDTYWLNSSFIQALSLRPWFEIKRCFHSVPSFAMIVFGLAKQVSTWKLSFMSKVNMLQWNNWSDRRTLVWANVFDVRFFITCTCKCYACKEKLAPFQRRVIQLPAKLDALAG